MWQRIDRYKNIGTIAEHTVCITWTALQLVDRWMLRISILRSSVIKFLENYWKCRTPCDMCATYAPVIQMHGPFKVTLVSIRAIWSVFGCENMIRPIT